MHAVAPIKHCSNAEECHRIVFHGNQHKDAGMSPEAPGATPSTHMKEHALQCIAEQTTAIGLQSTLRHAYQGYHVPGAPV